MKYSIPLFIFLIHTVVSIAQKDTKEIELEGKLLFRLEKGSWYGTDHFLENFAEKRDSIGGYLSYENENNRINTIFLNRFDSGKVIMRYEFDSIPKTQPILIDTTSIETSSLENDLIAIRTDALERVNKNKNDFFSFYKNTSLNFIPVISKNKKKVFIITGPQVNGVVLLGNDYLLEYDKKNNFKKKKKIHNSIIELQAKSDNPNQKILSTIHSHILSDFITSTDICTLLLYKGFVDWKQHTVISEKQVSIFNLDMESLLVVTRKAWEKINKQIDD